MYSIYTRYVSFQSCSLLYNFYTLALGPVQHITSLKHKIYTYMAVWLRKSGSALQYVKTRPGLPDILNGGICSGLTHLCTPYITSTFSRNEYPLHSSFLGLAGHSVRFQASQHSKVSQQEDHDYSVNDQVFFASHLHFLIFQVIHGLFSGRI